MRYQIEWGGGEQMVIRCKIEWYNLAIAQKTPLPLTSEASLLFRVSPFFPRLFHPSWMTEHKDNITPAHIIGSNRGLEERGWALDRGRAK